MLSVKQGSIKSLVWLDLGLNPDLPNHWWTLYSLGQWPGKVVLSNENNLHSVIWFELLLSNTNNYIAQNTVEYTDCFSAEG